MDMSREQRLTQLETAFANVPITEVGSSEELARAEQARAARHFGFAQPQFRTSVQLHFSGEGVHGHDLSGNLAGNIIAGFTDAVNATGAQLHMPPGSTELFLSPVVAAGSTVLEMYGAPGAPDERLDTEIDDTPVDKALGRLLALLDGINEAVGSPSKIAPIEGALGKRLFSLARNLIENNVDLGVYWTRPRGHVKSTNINRAAARILRDVLDTETVESRECHEIGKVVSISTTGVIGFTIDGKKVVIPITASGSDTEPLRALWAKPVDVAWIETVVSHPQREDKKIKHELISIREITAPSQ